MIKKIFSVAIALSLTGCAYFQKKPEPAPDDFIIEPTISLDQAIGSIKEQKPDYVVQFRSGKTDLSKRESGKLDKWLAEVSATNKLIVHGAAGAEKYQDIGEARTLSILEYLREKGYTTVMMPYDGTMPGKQAQIWAMNGDSDPEFVHSLLVLTVFPQSVKQRIIMQTETIIE